nr:retrovirus-related Pol polyprotein from transposon TNT 1-94 [Tanacetum cinerariifolium]
MIHVKFDELRAMTFECSNSKPKFNCMNFQDLSEDSQSVPSNTDLDNLFGPLYEEYYATSSPKVSDNYVANTLDNEDTSSSSSIIVKEDDAPQIDSVIEIIAYSDADHAGCKDGCKSTSGGIQFMGDKLVSWSSKKQDCTAMLTAEAEYVSLCRCCAQVNWMRT